MEEKKENQFIDADRFLDVYEEKIADYKRSPEVLEEFVDAAWDRADVGEETLGGSSPTPDQDVVDQLGESVGLTYEDNEPLDTEKKVAKRDERRWELDPASSEGYTKRVSHEGEYEG